MRRPDEGAPHAARPAAAATAVVARLWRYPVKSMLGEALRTVAVTRRGLDRDRAFALRTADGKLASGKNTRRFRQIDGLLAFRATLDGDWPEVGLPDGRQLRGDDPRIHVELSAALDVPVTLVREHEASHFDAAGVHLVTTASLEWLRSRLPGSRIDERRFRPNIVIADVADVADAASACPADTPSSGVGSEPWRIGSVVAIGDVRLRITAATERCRMTTLAQADLPEDPQVLRCIGREADLQFGVYAEVLTPGRIEVGQAVTLEPGERAPTP